jgi:hypothetical protein
MSAWRDDYRQMSNRDQFKAIAGLVAKHKLSVVFVDIGSATLRRNATHGARRAEILGGAQQIRPARTF